MFQIISAPLTDPGLKRRNNEDWTVQFEPPTLEERTQSGCLYIVADGVGGAAQGERASQYASQKVLYEYYHHPETPPAERLRQAMRRAGNEIYDYADELGQGRMATTMVAAVILDDKLTVANVGDSRAYLLRDGTAHQITRDHSLVGEMVRDGSMTEEESLQTKVKNSLTRSLGGERDTHVDLFELDIQPGDRLLLCTDGLLRYTTRKEITAMLSNGTPQEVAERMVNYALEQGGADNITVLPIEIGLRLEEGSLGVAGSVKGPEPADWELMTTEPITRPVSTDTPAQRRRSRRKQNHILYGLIGGVVLLTLVAVIIFIILPPTKMANPSADLTPSSVEVSVPTGTNDPAAVAAVVVDTETPTPTLIFSETPKMTSASIITPTMTMTPGLVTCVYQVDLAKDEWLSSVLYKFGINYQYCDEKYNYYSTCGAVPDKPDEVQCSDLNEITFTDPATCKNTGTDYDTGVWVEIQNITKEACLEGGGKITLILSQ